MLSMWLRFLSIVVLLISCEFFAEQPKQIPPSAKPPGFEATTDLPAGMTFEPAALGKTSFHLRLLDPDKVVEHSVIFVTVNRQLGGGQYEPHVGLHIFKSISVEPDVFRKVLLGSDLRAGISVSFDFRLRSDAQAGRYTINFQLFNGPDTNPNTVQIQNRIGTANFVFGIGDGTN
jgi:hypothetical protein